MVWLLTLLWLPAWSMAETLISEAKILKITERGFILRVGTDPLAVEDTPETKWWRDKSQGKREAFKEGDSVYARIKTNADPPILRELADKASWQWLDSIRKGSRSGKIEKIDPKYITLKLDDGSTFTYRASDKSQVKLKGKPSSLGELQAGMKVYAKGRTLANLETWLALVADEPIPETAAKETKKKKEKLEPIPLSGVLQGSTLGMFIDLKMFDMISGVRALHISYSYATKWFFNGKTAKSSAFQRDLDCIVTYRRDKAGRIIATKVELFERR